MAPTRAMPTYPETFVLRSTVTSPFGRKVRIAAAALGMDGRITLTPADPLNESDTLRQQNPLGKMPCLLLADGSTIYDSGVIIEFLQEVSGSDRMVPAHGLARFNALTRARLADGITEAAILLVYEGRFRDPDKHSERWVVHQRGKIARALDAFEKSLPDAAKTDIVAIGLACALGYLDWRKPMEWRTKHPRLVEWLDAFAKSEPAYLRTPPEPARNRPI
jgi:glutathione S-transferase